jgi:hypothetical protein
LLSSARFLLSWRLTLIFTVISCAFSLFLMFRSLCSVRLLCLPAVCPFLNFFATLSSSTPFRTLLALPVP